ncbi:MAG TPA: lipoprotein [Rhodoferax sp.]|jgi:predicted small lipoprotein YifL|nr:lipoprotein [Rhodoferax sp.]HQC87198.1 lipoprotein [Rhodoferax sp.]HQY75900.1 lipoprotein [Rhodoferax sp.]
MLKAKQILVSAIVLGAVVLNLAGCGQTGALYLPERASPKPFAPATPVVTPESKKP